VALNERAGNVAMAALAFFAIACAPSIEDGQFRCRVDSDCPEELRCRVDVGFCFRALLDDGSVRRDASADAGARDGGADATGGALDAAVDAEPHDGGRVLRVSAFGLGQHHACAIDEAGALHCWGANDAAQLGLGTTSEPVTTPAPVAGEDWTAVTAGEDHTCGLREDGSVWCWGSNGDAQLGVPGGDRTSPVQVGEASAFRANAISAGRFHMCSVDAAGTVRCWGRNANGELGTGDGLEKGEPTMVDAGRSYLAVASGGAHTCGIAADRTLWCWGLNDRGQLGSGPAPSRVLSPRQVGTSADWTNVSAGKDHTCGIRSGELYCWGSGETFATGLGDTANRDTPARVGAAFEWNGLSAGRFHTCGREVISTYCWGANGFGEATGIPSPNVAMPAAMSRYLEIVASPGSFTCARGDDRVLTCWGANGEGEGATGATSMTERPHRIVF
jgi:alpha-tubulin suppressor-like RCC1 family protein